MSSPKRYAEKPATSSDHVALDNDIGMCERVAAGIAAIGEGVRRASLNKQQRSGGEGSNLSSYGDLSASAAVTCQPRGLLSTTDSLQDSSGLLGGALGAVRRPSASSTLDNPWNGGLFDFTYFPRPAAVRRPNLAPVARPLRLPAAASTSDRDVPCASLGCHYLTIRKSPYVYQTKEWREMNLSLYCPLDHDVMINTQTVDRISYESSLFFLGDSTGDYDGTTNGHAIHMLHHDPSQKKLYVIMSILFLKEQDYEYVMELLKRL